MDIHKFKDLLNWDRLTLNKAEGGTAIAVQITDRTGKNEIVGVRNEVVEISLMVPPTDERANKELVRFLAKQLGIKPESVEIVAGHSAPRKLVSIIGLPPQEVDRRLSL
jgi:uncharacterized protein (TIGR00251 family)